MKALACILLASAALAEPRRIDEIMRRVADNQAKSVEARKQFVYRQQEAVRMLHSNGKPTCEQQREYTVTPLPQGIERKLVSRDNGDGKCQVKIDVTSDSKHVSAGFGSEGDSFSVALGKTKDGVPRGLFPFTPEEQVLYQYKLAKTEIHDGRSAYRVTFRPNKNKDASGNQGYCKGELWIDSEEFQPLEMKADLSMHLFPGTNVRGKGFAVHYQRLAEGVWFPSSFGGEFSVQALFFFTNHVSVNVTNSDFKRTDVNSIVNFTGK